jgi:hypothetical protein
MTGPVNWKCLSPYPQTLWKTLWEKGKAGR